MKTKIICNKCHRIDYIEREAVQTENVSASQDNLLGIPIPSSNGLKSYSIVHDDHTVIVEIDAEGNVRRQQIIERIDQKQEKLISMITRELLYWNDERKSEVHLALVIQNKKFQKLLLGIFHQLILNGTDKYPALLEVKNGKAILDFAYIKVYAGKWNDNIISFGGENSLIIFELSKETKANILQHIKTIKQQNSFTNHAVLFDEVTIRTDEGKEIMRQILTAWPEFQALDMSNTEKAMISLYTLLRRFTST